MYFFLYIPGSFFSHLLSEKNKEQVLAKIIQALKKKKIIHFPATKKINTITIEPKKK